MDEDGILCDGNVVPLGGAVAAANLADFIVVLQAAWDGAGMTGTWSIVSGNVIQLSGTSCADVQIAFNL